MKTLIAQKSLSKSLILNALVLIAFSSCKPKVSSKVQSLDNFAGGSVVNSCKGAYSPSVFTKLESTNGSLNQAAVDSLSAVPTGLQDIFFGSYSGKIVITTD